MDEGPMVSLIQSLSITEYVFAQENWMKVIKYIIKCTDSAGESATLRSAKDFRALRKILVQRWPGCIIPTLPGSYSKVNNT